MSESRISRFYPALTHEQLREIGLRRRRDPDVKALLWEIARLQGIALRTNNIMKMLPENVGGNTLLLLMTLLRELLAQEPSVIREKELGKELLKRGGR